MKTSSANIRTGTFSSLDPSETFKLGRELGEQLTGGEIILLDGPLGAGKTIFVKGVAEGLNVDAEEVTSPSFTLVNPYIGRLPLFHIDLYRLDEGSTAADAVDLEELLSDPAAIIVIEWARRMGNYPLPDNAWNVAIAGDGSEPRTVSISRARGKSKS